MSQSIEKRLEEKAKTEKDAQQLWNQYSAMKDYLSRQYYPWIQANCPYFTDHGQTHIESVIESSTQILSKLLSKSKRTIEFSSTDTYLLLCSIIWHDVGMVFKRSGHSKQIEPILDKVKELGFPDPSAGRLVSLLVNAHEGRSGLNDLEEERDVTIFGKTYTVYPRALAAILRFSDEISENRSRISSSLLAKGKIPVANLLYWEYANCIVASRADPNRERVIVTIEIQKDKAISMFACPEECQKYTNGQTSISLIEYVIARLEKMNNERSYCGKEFGRYASIKSIVIRLELLKREKCIKKYQDVIVLEDSGIGTEEPNQIEVFQRFFNKYPHWSPTKIKKCRAK